MNLHGPSPSSAFAAGNYAAAALQGRPEEWQRWAALGLIGRTSEAVAGLERLDLPEARFYAAVARWIAGEDARAERELAALDQPHARRLLALIRQPKIRVLAQLDRGSQWDFLTALQQADKKFAVTNVGFRPGDLPNQPGADVRQFYDPAHPPDFYVAKLVEWHLLPPNLRALPCPILGHTADYDLHIQSVHPWLQLFDELVVTDPTEWADVSRLVSVPVATFPKAFGLATSRLPPVPDQARPHDVVISGTTLHPYHPDKARLLHQILALPEPAVFFLNGFLPPAAYLQLLGQSKLGFTYVRHPGAMPTRGLESLAMGAVIAVQEDSVLQLFLGEEEGVVTYDLAKANLPETIRRVLARWSDFRPRAQRGAALVRREFDLARVASQYFRFLTFLAAKPRPQRSEGDPAQARAAAPPPSPKRSILVKGWGQDPWVNRRLRQHVLAQGAANLEAAPSARLVNDLARELVLEYASAAHAPAARDHAQNFQASSPVDRDLLTQALHLYRQGVARFPDALVLRFNWVRAALHFGEPSEVTEALALAEDTLRQPPAVWQVDALDDVFPWDYFSQFFNYRAYFDLCTRHLQTGEPVQPELARLLTASLHYYLSYYDANLADGAPAPLEHARQALALDPAFPFYKLQYARRLVRLGTPEAAAQAAPLLAELADQSMLFLEAFELLEPLQTRGQCQIPQFEALAAKVRLARARLYQAAGGVEDWQAVPLRMPVTGRRQDGSQTNRRVELREEVLPREAPSPVSEPPPRPRILFFPLEIAEWQQARHLAYPAQWGLEEGLEAAGAECVTLPLLRGLSPTARHAWFRQMQAWCARQGPFDQVWIELVHSEWTEETLQWLTTVAPVRVGFLMESLRYDAEALRYAPTLRDRWEKVERRLRHVTHVLAVDEQDATEIEQRGLAAARWWPQAVPARSVRPLPAPAPDRRAVFYGQLYGQRQAWLELPPLRARLWRPEVSPEDAAGLPRQFDEVNRAFASLLDRGVALSHEQLCAHAAVVRRLRQASFEAWLDGLQQAGAVVNLPSLFQGYAGRVFEAMAAGRPVVSWAVPDRPRTRALFAEGEEILLFPKHDPEVLAEHLQRLQQRPDLGRHLAERARARLLREHTVESRTREILDWIVNRESLRGCVGENAAHTGEESGTRVTRPSEMLLRRDKLCESHASGWSPVQIGELHLALGAAHLHLGDAEAAWPQLQHAVTAQPENPAARVALARAAARLGRWPEVAAALEPLLVAEPDHWESWRLLGELCLETGQAAEAPAIHRMLAEREPHHRWIQVNRARAALLHGSPADAQAAPAPLREWIARHLPAAQEAAARRVKTSVLGTLPAVARVGALTEARELLRRADLPAAWRQTAEAIDHRPFHPEGWLLLAEIALAAGDLTQARACAERAKELAPGWKPARQFLKSLKAAKPNSSAGFRLPPLPPSLSACAPRLTVCLIARNEEQFLGRCLESIREVADQIVLVDTGSTDWTCQIAERFGAEVYHMAWTEDFSAARNAALERARGDWVLSLDADEELRPGDAALLRQELARPEVMAYRLPILTVGREEEGASYVPRLFRNAPGLFYVGRVHEQVFTSLEVRRAEWGLENRFAKATLLHYGYTEEVMKARNKSARNLALLERAVEEMPHEPNLVMNLGLELMRSGQPMAGLAHYWEAFRLLSMLPPAQVVPELRETLLTQLSTHLLGAGQAQEAVAVLRSPLAHSASLTATMHFTLGLAFMQLRQVREAIHHFRQSLALRDQPALSPARKELRQGGPHHCLALCWKALRQPREAEAAFRAALQEAPQSQPVRLDYAQFLAETGRPLEALRLLHALTAEDPRDLAAWVLGGQVALSRPEFLEFACDWTAEALKRCPAEPRLLEQRIEALLRHQDVQAAGVVLRQVRPMPSARLEAARLLCALLAGQEVTAGPWPEATLSHEFLQWYRALLAANAADLVAALNAKLDRLRGLLPSAARLLDQALQSVVQESAG